MNEIELVFDILLFGIILGLGIAYLQSRIDKDIWNHIRMLCGIAGGIFILFFIYFGYMVWYCIGVGFIAIVLYEPHKKDEYLPLNRFQFRERDVPPRFRNPYSRREERPQLEEWL